MHRELLRIGNFSIHSWGVMVALGFLLGFWYALRRAKRANFPQQHIYDISIVLMVCAIVGSRAWYVLTHLDEFRGNWLDVINPFQAGGFGISGMAMVGGVVGTIIAAAVFCIVRKINFFEIADIVAPSFLLGMFVGRWGCFLNGCCFGRECSAPWGVVFPEGSPAGYVFPHTHIHPTELYEAFLDLAFFFLLIKLEKKHRSFVGWSFWMTFLLYGLGRAIVDYWRWYEPQEIVVRYLGGNLSIHGAIALGLAAFAALMIAIKPGRKIPPDKRPWG